jgi:hypothetical protein
MLQRDQPYQDLGPDWLQRRHARQLVAQLERLGHTVVLDPVAGPIAVTTQGTRLVTATYAPAQVIHGSVRDRGGVPLRVERRCRSKCRFSRTLRRPGLGCERPCEVQTTAVPENARRDDAKVTFMSRGESAGVESADLDRLERRAVQKKASWLSTARDLGRALRDGGPLTVLVGAGASLSSGAPSNAQASGALAASASRMVASRLADQVHEVDNRDKAIALAPSFSRVVPGIGYRCLAALGRDRRVTLLDLNWDPAAEQAADYVGVAHTGYDIHDGEAWPATPLATGLVVPHLHGDLSAPRFGRGEKPSFESATIEHLAALHSGGRLLVVGASLEEDHDVRDLLAALHGNEKGVWAFLRDGNTEAALRFRNSLPGQTPTVCADEDVDFDRLMLLVVDEALSPSWAEHRHTHGHLLLPSLEDIVLPRRQVLVPALDAGVAVFVGDPQLGKTTLIHLLAHLHVVWAQAGSVRVASGAQASLAAVAVSGGSSPDDVVIVESPFGEAPDRAANPGFHDSVAARSSSPETPTLLIASRTGDWQEPPTWADGLTRASSLPSDWYRVEDLRRYARTFEDGETPSVLAEVRPGLLDTPGRVQDRLLDVPVEADRSGVGRDDLLDQGRRWLLEQDHLLGMLCALTRLQDYGGGPIEQAALEGLAGYGATATSHAGAMLRPYVFEGRSWLRLAMTSDRVAADWWISTNSPEVEAVVLRPDAPKGFAVGLGGWRLAQAAQSGRSEAGPLDVADHAGLLLDADPSETMLNVLIQAPFTSWTLGEAAHTLIRQWKGLPPVPRLSLLDRLLSDAAALGPYGVLEACLYLGGAADGEIWDRVKVSLWDLIRRRDAWQSALALDGLAWRLPPAMDTTREWAKASIAVVPAGALRVVAAYHPEGTRALGLASEAEQIAFAPWSDSDPAAAERLIVWHFVHQSRARAQMSRQNWVDKAYLCRTLHPAQGQGDSEAIDRLIGGLVNHGRTGWAFHAACFVMGALGRPVGATARRLLVHGISHAPDADLGLVTAACTYKIATEGEFAAPLQRYFSRQVNRDRLIDAYAGLTFPDGTSVRPPDAFFALPPAQVYGSLNIRFHRIARLGFDSTEPYALVTAIRPALDAAVLAGTVSAVLAGRLTQLVAKGDFRPLDDAVAAIEAAPEADLGVIAVRAAEDLEELAE